MRRDPLDERTNRLMHALADSGFEVMNIDAEKRGDEARVRAEMPGPSVNEAQSLASAYDFELVGELGEGRAFKKYEFRSKRSGREMFDPERDEGAGFGGML